MLHDVQEESPRRAGRFAVGSSAGLLALVAGSLGFLLLLTAVRAAWTPLYQTDQRVADTLNWLHPREWVPDVRQFGSHLIAALAADVRDNRRHLLIVGGRRSDSACVALGRSRWSSYRDQIR